MFGCNQRGKVNLKVDHKMYLVMQN